MDLDPKLTPLADDLAHALLDFLRKGAGPHATARGRALLVDDADPMHGAIDDGGLIAERSPPIRHDKKVTVQAFRKFFADAKAAGIQLHLVELNFTRQGEDWTYTGAVETSVKRAELEAARKPIDDGVGREALRVAGPGTRFVQFEQQLPGAPRLLALTEAGERKQLPPSPELEQLLQKTFELYRQFGRDLRWPFWKATAGEDEVATRMYYG